MEQEKKRDRVYAVFQRISTTYDAANLRISLGLERRWKARLVQSVLAEAEGHSQFLDVCCGTGDIALAMAAARPDVAVTGLDFSPAMLEVAARKGRVCSNVAWRQGDAMDLPFQDDTFHGAVISFGLRNTADYGQVLQEMKRVVKPGGRVYCLDSFVPDSPVIRPFYTAYFRCLMPLLGGGWQHRREYQWLWKSTQEFLRKDELTTLFQQAGLHGVQAESFLFGACVLHSGQK